jgi:hypothetical protein
MAEKTAPADNTDAVESTVKVVEDVMAKAQAQYLSVLSESQNLALDAYKTMVDTMSRFTFPMPELPGMTAVTQMPATIVDSAFEFGAAVLESQRSFAKKVFEVSAG